MLLSLVNDLLRCCRPRDLDSSELIGELGRVSGIEYPLPFAREFIRGWSGLVWIGCCLVVELLWSLIVEVERSGDRLASDEVRLRIESVRIQEEVESIELNPYSCSCPEFVPVLVVAVEIA